jgi:hypothetical protein
MEKEMHGMASKVASTSESFAEEALMLILSHVLQLKQRNWAHAVCHYPQMSTENPAFLSAGCCMYISTIGAS